MFEELVGLSDKTLGKGYLTERDFHNYYKDNNYWIVCARNEKEQLIGFVIFGIEDRVGIIKTLAVDDHYQDKGIGKKLFVEAFNILRQQVKEVITIIDSKSKSANIAKEKDEFFFVKEIKNYWYQLSVERNLQCFHCGNPCNCSAYIYKLST